MVRTTLAVICMVSAVSVITTAQSASIADLQRLQDVAFDASNEIAQARARDATTAAQLERELDEVRDDIAYLRGKLRREGSVVQREVDDVRDRLNGVRTRARAAAGGITTSAPMAGPREIPVGTELDVRLQTTLTSATAKPEDRFEATTVMNLDNDERVLIPAGSVLRGIVSAVNRPGRLDRRGSLTLAFDQITVRGQALPLCATVTQALESEGVRGEAGRIGAGAGVGAVIGGILGGFKGVLTGILVGGGGVIAATEGRDLTIPVGSILRVRLDSPVALP
jgi:hypothetical protein